MQYIYENFLFLHLQFTCLPSIIIKVSIDNNCYKKIIEAKFKPNFKLSARYTSEDIREWLYCNINDYKILLLLKQRVEL